VPSPTVEADRGGGALIDSSPGEVLSIAVVFPARSYSIDVYSTRALAGRLVLLCLESRVLVSAGGRVPASRWPVAGSLALGRLCSQQSAQRLEVGFRGSSRFTANDTSDLSLSPSSPPPGPADLQHSPAHPKLGNKTIPSRRVRGGTRFLLQSVPCAPEVSRGPLQGHSVIKFEIGFHTLYYCSASKRNLIPVTKQIEDPSPPKVAR
jgi:hypothetical protein